MKKSSIVGLLLLSSAMVLASCNKGSSTLTPVTSTTTSQGGTSQTPSGTSSRQEGTSSAQSSSSSSSSSSKQEDTSKTDPVISSDSKSDSSASSDQSGSAPIASSSKEDISSATDPTTDTSTGEDVSSSEASTSESKKYDVASKYALIVEGVAYEMTHNDDAIDPSFDEYYALNIYVSADDHVWMYDSEYDVEFNFVKIAGATGFYLDGDAIICTIPGEYDFYAKFKMGEDELYIAEHGGEESSGESSTWEGPKYDVLSKYALIVDGVAYEMNVNEDPLDPSFDEYYVLDVLVYEESHVWMYDSENDAEFNFKKISGSSAFVLDGDDIVCVETGSYDFYAKFKFEEDELYIGEHGGEESSSGDSSETTSGEEEKKYDVSSKYALIVDGVAYEMTYNEEPLDPSFDEYYVLGIEVAADAHVWMYDSENNVEFNFVVVTGSEKFVVDGSDIICTVGGTFDFYAKFKFEADELYIGEVGGEEESTSSESSESSEITSGEEEKKYDVESKYALIVDGVAYEMTYNEDPLDPSFDEYYVVGVEVGAESHVWMYDSENNVEFNFVVVTGSDKFVVVDSDIICTVGGTFDFYAKFKFEADELYIGEVGGEEESTSSESSETSETSDKKYDVESKYAIVIDGVAYELTQNDDPLDPSYDEYYVKGVACSAGDVIYCYDSENDAEWEIAIFNTYSVGFEQVDGHITCKEDGTYDIYLKLKWQADEIYIGASNIE